MTSVLRILLLTIFLNLPFVSFASSNTAHVVAELIQEEEGIQAGRPFSVAFHLQIDPNWHINGAVPLQTNWELPPGFTASAPQLPPPENFSIGGIDGTGYANELILLSEITPPKELSPDSTHAIKAKLSWVVCSDLNCQPGTYHALLTVKTVNQTPQKNLAVAAIFALGRQALFSTPPTEETSLVLALLFAFIGGMILNLMPCVLPVMSLKVMSFVKMAGQCRTKTLIHGLMFSLGVVVSFWALASLMIALRSYGQAVGWGFQLQEPYFVVILATLLFVFALNLFGVFEWGLSMASWAGQAEAEKSQDGGKLSSFFSGVLATAIATPCTGPFLGTAVGIAVSLPLISSLLVFTFLGLGMSFPYLLLAAFPSCLSFIPKPGAWMETFKQIMGFVLLGSVLWLAWVFSAQTGTFSLMCLLAGFFCLSISAWAYGKSLFTSARTFKRLVAYACVVFFLLGGLHMIFLPREHWHDNTIVAEHHVGWEKFSPERVAELRAKGVPVLIDFTAKWCLICQANHFVFTSQEVDKRLNEAGVVKMKADWTKNDPVITQELNKFGRNSVPLYVVYGSDPQANPVILPQVLTPDSVLSQLDEALPKEQIADKE